MTDLMTMDKAKNNEDLKQIALLVRAGMLCDTCMNAEPFDRSLISANVDPQVKGMCLACEAKVEKAKKDLKMSNIPDVRDQLRAFHAESTRKKKTHERKISQNV